MTSLGTKVLDTAHTTVIHGLTLHFDRLNVSIAAKKKA